MKKIKKVHLIAICGTGMSALAGLLRQKGYTVTGSDQNIYPPISEVLKDLGIESSSDFSPLNINKDLDLIIIGNAVSKNNPEVQEVFRRNIPYLSFPQALARFFLRGKYPLVIAGTHGKTTTSSLLAWVLEATGEDPGFMIGGVPRNFNTNYKYGTGKYFVLEGDEYDTAFFDKRPKFLHYLPQSAILTSIEFDHADIYRNLKEIKNFFREFVKLIPEKGRLLIAQDDPEITQLVKEAKIRAEIETYGLSEKADWSVREIKSSQKGIFFKVYFQRRDQGDFFSPLFGRHNLKNVLAVIALTSRLKIPREKIKKSLQSFQGVKRRQEIIAFINDIIIMDDFAHHPTAVYETLSALKLHYPKKRIWAIFEPRSATSRRNVFQKEFIRAFSPGDKIIIADLFSPEKISADNRLEVKRLVEDLKKEGKDSEFIPGADQIAAGISEKLKPGDLVCIMSSGGFDNLPQKLRGELTRR